MIPTDCVVRDLALDVNGKLGKIPTPARDAKDRDMTKSELIEAVAGRGNLTKERAAVAVNNVFDSMTEALQRGDRIEIRNFGNFVVKEYRPYTGRNPKTGDTVEVPSKRMPFFKVGLELKDRVNEGA